MIHSITLYFNVVIKNGSNIKIIDYLAEIICEISI